MNHINELSKTLNHFFDWHKSRMNCLAKIIFGLFTLRTVNLAELACSFSADTKSSSSYRRLQRFFYSFHIDLNLIALFVFRLFDLGKEPKYLLIDRTNWQWGNKDINIFTLALSHKGVGLPIFGDFLSKKGNSKTQERINLIQKFIKLFGKSIIKGVLADREFIGRDWFSYLIQNEIPFYIRIKNNAVTTNSRGLAVDINGLFHGVKVGEKRALKGKRKIWGNYVYLAATRSINGELLIVATNRDPENAIEIYSKRWEIETLFGCLKSKGFCFEDTRMVDGYKIQKLFAILTIGFCWAYQTGLWKNEKLKIKSHGRLAKSLFRIGLDYIRETLFQVFNKINIKKRLLKKLILNLAIEPLVNGGAL